MLFVQSYIQYRPAHAPRSSFLKLDIPFTNVRIYIEPPLLIHRDPLPGLLNLLPLQLRIHDLLPLARFHHHRCIRPHHHAMPPRMITRLHVPRGAAHAHVALIIHRPRPRLQLPMHRPRCQVKRPRVEEEKGAPPRRDRRQLGEADVVADRQPDLSVRRHIHDRHLVPRGQHLGFSEGDFAGDVDVEEVDFAVRGEEFPARRE